MAKAAKVSRELIRRVVVIDLVIAILLLVGGGPVQSAPVIFKLRTTFPLLKFDQTVYDYQDQRIPDTDPNLIIPNTNEPEVVCGSNKGFLVEFADGSGNLQDPRVPFEWAPVVPGYPRPTVSEPLFVVSGDLVEWIPPDKDLKFSHPFGPDYSMNIDLIPDTLTKLNLHAQKGLPMHAEIESGLFPYADLGWGAPRSGDWVLLKGDWIVDCGHPGTPPHVTTIENFYEAGYSTEIHPPTFLAFARASGTSTSGSTDSIAIVNPYRPTQLFNGNENLANDFQNYKRFTDSGTGTFSQSLYGELGDSTPHIGIHQLVEPTDFGVVGWTVCAPRPFPASLFVFSYRFTARTGVGIQVFPDPANKCLRIVAVQDPTYTPAPQTRKDVTWSWNDINKDIVAQTNFNVDVQKAIGNRIYDACHHTLCPQLQKVEGSNSPFIDSYDPLHTRPGAGAPLGNGERVIMRGADDQPFPFYGKIRVGWAKAQIPLGPVHPPTP